MTSTISGFICADHSVLGEEGGNSASRIVLIMFCRTSVPLGGLLPGGMPWIFWYSATMIAFPFCDCARSSNSASRCSRFLSILFSRRVLTTVKERTSLNDGKNVKRDRRMVSGNHTADDVQFPARQLDPATSRVFRQHNRILSRRASRRNRNSSVCQILATPILRGISSSVSK